MAMGAALGEMAGDSKRSTEQILNDMLKQITAMMLRSIMSSNLPLSAKLIAAVGSGALSSGLFSSQVPGYATGTDYHPGGLAMVGERGPELVNLPRGSSVMTNHESMQMNGKVVFEIGAGKLWAVLQQEINNRTYNS